MKNIVSNRLFDQFIKKMDKELIDFHKTQKTGFYDFEPYFDDFYHNTFSFSGSLYRKYRYKEGSGEAGVHAAGMTNTKSDIKSAGYINFVIYIHLSDKYLSDKSCFLNQHCYYTIYPDCIFYESSYILDVKRKMIYKKVYKKV